MALLSRRTTRIGLVGLGATLLVSAPTMALAAPVQPLPGPGKVVFFTPVAADTVSGHNLHVVLGASSDVQSVRLEASTDTVSWESVTTIARNPSTGVFDVTATLPSNLTSQPGVVHLEAIGYNATIGGSQVGTPTLEDITVSPTAGTTLTLTNPRTGGALSNSLIGVYRRKDGHWFSAVSGTTTGTTEPHAVDAEAATPPPAPVSAPAPTGVFSGSSFTEPVDLSAYASQGMPTAAAIRVSDGISSNATVASLYDQVVTAVRASTAAMPGTSSVTINARVTDQFGQPVVGVPVRLAGWAAGASAPYDQLAVTNVLGQASFTGPTPAAGYPAGGYTVYADLNLSNSRGSKEPSYEVVNGTVTYADPGKSFYHSDKPIKKAGGVYADAIRGTRAASAAGYTWIDQDGQLSYKTKARLRAGAGRISQASDIVWVNAHGSPFNPKWLKKKKNNRFEEQAWNKIKHHAGLRDVAQTFRQDAAYGLSVEWEVKDVHPLTKAAALNAAFANLASAAKTYYGAAWAEHVQVKVLSNLHGGSKYALKVLKHAHKYGFTTFYLARGKATKTQIPASAQSYVTYVRGAAGGVFPAIPSPSQNTPIVATTPHV